MKVNILRASESEFYWPDELSHAELLQSPTHSESKERNLTLFANEEAHHVLKSQQTNRRSRKQLSPEAKLLSFEGIHRGPNARKPKKKTKCDVNVFFEFAEFLGEFG